MTISTSFQRRKEPRVATQLQAEILVASQDGAEKIIPCQVLDLSRHGVCFEAEEGLFTSGVRSRVRFEFPKASHASVTLKPVRQRPSVLGRAICAAELMFDRESERRKLHTYLSSLGGSVRERRVGERRNAAAAHQLERRVTNRRKDYGVFRECASFASRVGDWKSTYTIFRQTEATHPARIVINGRELISFGTNDYLGLSHDPRVKEAARKAVERYGTSAGSRVLNGTLNLHEELEQGIADFKGTETALVFGGGYLANIGILTGLLKKDDVVFIDEKVHVSVIDGCIFSAAKIVPFRHNSIDDLGRKIQRVKGSRNLLIVDGVYSIEGDLARLPEIQALASAHHIPVMVDDAHGFGVLGPRGAGTADHFHMNGHIELDMGTLSGVLGGIGGFVACQKYIGDYLRHFSKGFLFTTSLPPATTAGLLEALRILKTDESLRTRLWSNMHQLKEGLKELGFKISATESAIVSILIGHEQTTYEIVRSLEDRGVYVSSFIRPAVKRGEARIRMTVSSAHSQQDISQALDAFKSVRPAIDLAIEKHG
ncbi:MAG: aminotransferase class I/II-fold pyridoxal phosphate-dependent enzyme [Nitrospirae bacterium]|nr:aminotransferase class I/II-fold pyridoxal phosphate-dependent enzyme [Nitrospirota bacterium]